MRTFQIEIVETLSRVVDIEAETIEEALEKANQMYEDEEIILDYTANIDLTINPYEI